MGGASIAFDLAARGLECTGGGSEATEGEFALRPSVQKRNPIYHFIRGDGPRSGELIDGKV